MGRAPCCEKMGLKKGPWTPEEDKILVAHIQRFGHGNWRALPKQAGKNTAQTSLLALEHGQQSPLSPCGDIIIQYIILMGPSLLSSSTVTEGKENPSVWSAIAARLPGRTDNEIKNVWHTHLKKRLEPTNKQDHAPAAAGASNKKKQKPAAAPKRGGAKKTATAAPVSPDRSVSSSVTESSTMTEQGNMGSSGFAKEESFTSSEEFQIDESFWSETLSMPLESFDVPMEPSDAFGASSAAGGADDMDFWLRVFMETDDVKELPQI
ncbi:hypothetical protein PR202_ga19684 [Eleusine coracana subsp. coracana]|uniref:Uncharacterized protein n=1 Tax=Eleusine coracana subsp. coracana TaxID=191504 RepID=A0AAV5CVS8_ELECO|nr:hypothetical protein PR202_ga19684 [Eleusine coracana subsp. coracana]